MSHHALALRHADDFYQLPHSRRAHLWALTLLAPEVCELQFHLLGADREAPFQLCKEVGRRVLHWDPMPLVCQQRSAPRILFW